MSADKNVQFEISILLRGLKDIGVATKGITTMEQALAAVAKQMDSLNSAKPRTQGKFITRQDADEQIAHIHRLGKAIDSLREKSAKMRSAMYPNEPSGPRRTGDLSGLFSQSSAGALNIRQLSRGQLYQASNAIDAYGNLSKKDRTSYYSGAGVSREEQQYIEALIKQKAAVAKQWRALEEAGRKEEAARRAAANQQRRTDSIKVGKQNAQNKLHEQAYLKDVQRDAAETQKAQNKAQKDRDAAAKQAAKDTEAARIRAENADRVDTARRQINAKPAGILGRLFGRGTQADLFDTQENVRILNKAARQDRGNEDLQRAAYEAREKLRGLRGGGPGGPPGPGGGGFVSVGNKYLKAGVYAAGRAGLPLYSASLAGAAYAGVAGITSSLEAFGTRESGKLFLAGSLNAFNEYQGKDGRLIQGKDKFGISQGYGNRIYEQIRQTAKKSPLTQQELFNYFSVGYPFLASKGVKAENAVPLVSGIASLGKFLGLREQSVAQDIRAIGTGVYRNLETFQAAGVGPKEFKELAGLRGDALAQRINKVIVDPFSESVSRYDKTYKGGLTLLEDAKFNLGATFGEKMAPQMASSVRVIIDSINRLSESGALTKLANFINGAIQAFTNLVDFTSKHIGDGSATPYVAGAYLGGKALLTAGKLAGPTATGSAIGGFSGFAAPLAIPAALLATIGYAGNSAYNSFRGNSTNKNIFTNIAGMLTGTEIGEYNPDFSSIAINSKDPQALRDAAGVSLVQKHLADGTLYKIKSTDAYRVAGKDVYAVQAENYGMNPNDIANKIGLKQKRAILELASQSSVSGMPGSMFNLALDAEGRVSIPGSGEELRKRYREYQKEIGGVDQTSAAYVNSHSTAELERGLGSGDFDRKFQQYAKTIQNSVENFTKTLVDGLSAGAAEVITKITESTIESMDTLYVTPRIQSMGGLYKASTGNQIFQMDNDYMIGKTKQKFGAAMAANDYGAASSILSDLTQQYRTANSAAVSGLGIDKSIAQGEFNNSFKGGSITKITYADGKTVVTNDAQSVLKKYGVSPATLGGGVLPGVGFGSINNRGQNGPYEISYDSMGKRLTSWNGQKHADLDRLAAEIKAAGWEVTSTTNGKHGAGSNHYDGRAIDIRSKTKSQKEITAMVKTLQDLGLYAIDEQAGDTKNTTAKHIHTSLPRAWRLGNRNLSAGLPRISMGGVLSMPASAVLDPEERLPGELYRTGDEVKKLSETEIQTLNDLLNDTPGQRGLSLDGYEPAGVRGLLRYLQSDKGKADEKAKAFVSMMKKDKSGAKNLDSVEFAKTLMATTASAAKNKAIVGDGYTNDEKQTDIYNYAIQRADEQIKLLESAKLNSAKARLENQKNMDEVLGMRGDMLIGKGVQKNSMYAYSNKLSMLGIDSDRLTPETFSSLTDLNLQGDVAGERAGLYERSRKFISEMTPGISEGELRSRATAHMMATPEYKLSVEREKLLKNNASRNKFSFNAQYATQIAVGNVPYFNQSGLDPRASLSEITSFNNASASNELLGISSGINYGTKARMLLSGGTGAGMTPAEIAEYKIAMKSMQAVRDRTSASNRDATLRDEAKTNMAALGARQAEAGGYTSLALYNNSRIIQDARGLLDGTSNDFFSGGYGIGVTAENAYTDSTKTTLTSAAKDSLMKFIVATERASTTLSGLAGVALNATANSNQNSLRFMSTGTFQSNMERTSFDIGQELEHKLALEGKIPGTQGYEDRKAELLRDPVLNAGGRLSKARYNDNFANAGSAAVSAFMKRQDPITAFAGALQDITTANNNAMLFGSNEDIGKIASERGRTVAGLRMDAAKSQIGMMAGSMIVNSVFNPDKSYSGEGMAIGSALGPAMFSSLGPYGAAVGLVAGGLFGGLFKKKSNTEEDAQRKQWQEKVAGLLSSIDKTLRPVPDIFRSFRRDQIVGSASKYLSGRIYNGISTQYSYGK